MVHSFYDISSFRDACAGVRARGKRVGLIPTMGALHEGHLALVREAHQYSQWVAATIFVNPIQFGPQEDLARYPRNLDADMLLLGSANAHAVFAPEAESMYSPGEQTRVRVGSLASTLCGAHRPGHFEGVATVVTKLFLIAGPCVAFFGSKDYQQLQVIRRVVRDLFLPVTVIAVPTVREPDGLAMSSRNRYLSAQERTRALALVAGLREAQRLFARGERRAGALRQAVRAPVEAAAASIDYVEIACPDTLEIIPDSETIGAQALVAIAARIGTTRLIDNIVLGEEATVGELS